jgi:threonine/homoserine efflux transporter RhtA
MTAKRIFFLTALALIAFAANSVLARLALLNHEIGPLGFTLIRLVSGAMVLILIVGPKQSLRAGRWRSALALVSYAGVFSFAYIV